MSRFELDLLLKDLLHRVHVLEVTQPMGYSAVSRGQSRFVGVDSIRVEGSGSVDGLWLVTGRLEGSGTFDWTGPMWLRGSIMIPGNLTGVGDLLWSGPWEMRGNGDITGNVDITGALDVLNRLSLGPSGYIESGSVRIDRFGSYGGRVASTGGILLLDAASAVLVGAPALTANDIGAINIEATNITAWNSVNSVIKNFKIPHPTKACHVLRHGSTESPVSGVEYWGEETLDDDGELTVILPDYFEALTKQENRAVMVTARGFVADWGDIENGSFTVTGVPGGRFSWLVKAERAGADFPVEEALPREA